MRNPSSPSLLSCRLSASTPSLCLQSGRLHSEMHTWEVGKPGTWTSGGGAYG